MGIITKTSIALGLLSSVVALNMGTKGAEVDFRPLVIPPLNNNAEQVKGKGIPPLYQPLYQYLVLKKNPQYRNSTPNPTIPEKIIGLLKYPKNNVIIISDDFREADYKDLPHGDMVTSIAIAEIIRLNKGKLPENTYVIGIDYKERGEFLDQLNKAEIKAKVYINFSWYFIPDINNQPNADISTKLTIDRIAKLTKNTNVKVFLANGNNEISGLAFGAQCLHNVYPVAATDTTIGSGDTAEIANYSIRLPIQLKAPGAIFGKSKSGIFDFNDDGRPDWAFASLLTFLRPGSIEATGTSFASPTTLAEVFTIDYLNEKGIKPSPEIKDMQRQVRVANEKKKQLCDSNGRLIEKTNSRG